MVWCCLRANSTAAGGTLGGGCGLASLLQVAFTLQMSFSKPYALLGVFSKGTPSPLGSSGICSNSSPFIFFRSLALLIVWVNKQEHYEIYQANSSTRATLREALTRPA
jgi:hypothetical protein